MCEGVNVRICKTLIFMALKIIKSTGAYKIELTNTYKNILIDITK